MKKKINEKDKTRDLKGRTPEQVLKEHGNRVIFPYMDQVDAYMCFYNNDIDGVKEVCKYRDDKMELLRRRDPVNWALMMIKAKKEKMKTTKKVTKKVTKKGKRKCTDETIQEV